MSGRARANRGGGGAAVVVLLAAMTAALSGTAGGCKQDKQSLVIAHLRLAAPDARAMNLVSATLTPTPGAARTFELTMLSADSTADFGLYIAAGVTGDVPVLATAAPRE